MAATINDLYLKYVNKVGRTLESDRYFQYLFAMVQASQNTLQQNSQVLHKIVDERWLSTIEDSLDSINKIIEKPRRFVARHEEVVPVDLAKRITADSVRHLSMNTQFIASSPDSDEVYPTRVLSVSTEDSYDLYENRFIYHLIQRLVVFIDKRTDVIFWSTGDETRNTLKFESKIDDAYEQIEYKLEMSVKNNQSFAENDGDNMQVFMRIDRVRRLVMALRDSSFCSLMAGCAKVRSPIQRTNLLMKDPDYRKCYQLWQFLESYDEVGYTIDVKESAMQFDEEYLLQMYTNLITGYTVFKSLLESDPRKMEEISQKHRKPIKPKFVKKIEEHIVEDRNIEEVEIRQVFVEEVTEAQLAAEAKLAEETQRADEAEKTLDELEEQMRQTMQQLQTANESLIDAEDRAEIAEQEKDVLTQEKSALQTALEESEQSVRQTQERVDELQSDIETRTRELEEARQALLRAEETAAAAQAAAEKARAAAEEAAKAQASADADRDAARQQAQAAMEAKQAADKAAAEARESERAAKAQSEADSKARAAAEETMAQARNARTAAEKAAAEAKKKEQAAVAQSDADRKAREEAEKAAAEAKQKERAAVAQSGADRKAREEAERTAEAARRAKAAADKAADEARKSEVAARAQAEANEIARKTADEAAALAQAAEARAEAAAQTAEEQIQQEREARLAAEKTRDKVQAKLARREWLFGRHRGRDESEE